MASKRVEAHRAHGQILSDCSMATRTMHADDAFALSEDVAPPMHVATTFRYSDDPSKLITAAERMASHAFTEAPVDEFIYSRLSAPTSSRLEAILTSILNGRALTYSSGLAAFHALMVFFNPKRIAIGDGYHGCHGVLGIMEKLTGLKKVDLHADDAAWDAAGLGKGDIVHIETPLNPTGEAYDIADYARRAHARGAILTVDSTFGPPGLQDPFLHGADAVMHSGTKYIGGHSDMLCGVVAVQRDDWWAKMFGERVYLGSSVGSLEGWLGLRSLRTLELRVQRQSETATKLASWLSACLRGQGSIPSADDAALVKRTVVDVKHASLQAPSAPWLAKQMPNGYGPVFSMYAKSGTAAKHLPSNLLLFQHATSLGGVESLIEWRSMSDDKVDERLLRVSVGIESPEDLWRDLIRAFKAVDKLQ